jgi:hypothetical protein
MTVQQFRTALANEEPPSNLSPALCGLWWDAKGNWTRGHECAQRDDGPAGAWVHAYLHRKEGDATNAAYWYARAGKEPSRLSLEQEWTEITEALLQDS